MEAFYTALFGIAAVLAAVLEYGNRAGRNAPGNSTREFAMFRNNYLMVYSLMMGKAHPDAAWPANTRVAPPLAPLAMLLLTLARSARCACSRRLAAGPLRVRPLPILWLRARGHRQAVHCRLWLLNGFWHHRGQSR